MRLLVASFLVLGLLLPASARATVARYLELDEHFDTAQLVIRGVVGAVRTRIDRDDGRPRTETEVQVLETFKGSRGPGTALTVRQMAGPVPPDGFLRIAGDPELRPGEELILFLEVDEHGACFLTALGQSKFTVLRDPDGPRVVRDLEGIEFYLPGAAARIDGAPHEAPIALELFTTLLRELATRPAVPGGAR